MAPAGAEDLSTKAPERRVVDYEFDQATRAGQVSDEEDGKLQAQTVDGPPAVGEEPTGTGVMPRWAKPAPVSMPQKVRSPVCAMKLRTSDQNVRYVGRVKQCWKDVSRLSKDLGRSLPGSIFGPPPAELVF